MAQPPPGYPTSGMNKPVAPYGYGEEAQRAAGYPPVSGQPAPGYAQQQPQQQYAGTYMQQPQSGAFPQPQAGYVQQQPGFPPQQHQHQAQPYYPPQQQGYGQNPYAAPGMPVGPNQGAYAAPPPQAMGAGAAGAAGGAGACCAACVAACAACCALDACCDLCFG